MVSGGLAFIFGIFNGFVINFPAMPVYWKWLNRVVPTTWMLYGLASSQLGRVDTPLVKSDGSETTVRQYLADTFGYEYDFRWAQGRGKRAGASGQGQAGRGKRAGASGQGQAGRGKRAGASGQDGRAPAAACQAAWKVLQLVA